PGDAIDGAAANAHLRPAGLTMLTGAAAGVVMHHDARTDTGRALIDSGASRCHDAARLMSGDDRALNLAESKRGGRTGCAVEFEIAAAHARGLDFDDHIVRPRYRIWKFGKLELSIAEESHAAHGFSLLSSKRLGSASQPAGAAS